MLAGQFLTDLRRIDVQRRDVEKRLATAVRASGTTVTEIFGAGPAVAAAVLGDVGDISRFASPDSSAAYNGTAPVEVSSGNRVIHRLSLHGNRRMNHAVHMAAVAQIRYQHSKGRVYYDKKIAEGKTSKEALRAQTAGQRRPPHAAAESSTPLGTGTKRNLIGRRGLTGLYSGMAFRNRVICTR